MIQQDSTATLKWVRKIVARAAASSDPNVRSSPPSWVIVGTHPPVHSVPVRNSRPRIFLAGAYLGLDYVEKYVPEILRTYGLPQNCDISCTRHMGLDFWQTFFSAADFVGSNKTCSIPSVILTNGVMRFTDDGPGSSANVGHHLKQFGLDWGIPVEVREPQ